MARARYPSDDARLKIRPHVKVHLSWPTHPRYGRAYADRDLRAIVLGVWMLAARAHASKTGDKVYLGPDQVAETTACRRPDVALTWLQRAADVMGWSLERHGDVVSIEVRNFARKQGFDSAGRGVPPPTPPPSDSDSDSDSEFRIPPSLSVPSTSSSTSSSAPKSKSRAKPKTPKTLAPREHPPAQRLELEAWATSRGFNSAQVQYAIERVYDWSHGGNKMMSDWVATTRNAMCDGWALKGFSNGSGAPAGDRRESFADQQQKDLDRWIRESRKPATA